MVIAMQIATWYVCHRNGWGQLVAVYPKRVIKTALSAWLGFFAIGLVLWGIYTGAFSPTEAAGVTAGFCMIAGLLSFPIHRYLISPRMKARSAGLNDLEADLEAIDNRSFAGSLIVEGFSPARLPSLILRSGQITGLLAPLIAVSVVMQQILTLLGAEAFVTGLINQLGGFYPVLFACMIMVMVVGTLLESLPVTIILAPILAPIAAGIGVDPVHFSVIFLVGAAIGFVTPPYGLNLYVASGITGIPYFQIVRHILPFLVALILAWLVIALVPQLSLGLLAHEGAGVFQ